MQGICSVCGQRKRVRRNRKSGKAICHNCYRKDPATHEKCSECGEVKYVAARTESGQAICNNCYHRGKVGICVQCKQKKVIQALGFCYACYQRQHRRKLANAT